MIDIHSHILPGLDDGPKDLSESLEMARRAVADGVSAMVATPHMMPDGPYANRRGAVMERLAELKEALARENVPLEVLPGGEVYVSLDVARELGEGSLLTLADLGAHVLIELPAGEIPPYTEQVLFEVRLRRIVPVIAHPERIVRSPEDLETLAEWVRKGVLLQVNGRSLLGESGTGPAKAARAIIVRRMAHFVASDAHGTTKRPPGLSAARREVERIAGPEEARLLVEENPGRLIAGEAIPAREPAPARRGLFDRLFKRLG